MPCERGETKAGGRGHEYLDLSTWPNLFGFCWALDIWAFVYYCVVSYAANHLNDALIPQGYNPDNSPQAFWRSRSDRESAERRAH